MTGKTTTLAQHREELQHFPEYPPRDDLQNWLHLYETAIVTSLGIQFAGESNVTVACEVPVSPGLPVQDDVRIPDLMVIRGANRELMEEQWGYAIDQQGKAPDFVLEVASPTTGRTDYTDKRRDYERYGVGEYWRFDPSGGEYHDAALAGDRLVDGAYQPIDIEELDDGRLRGYSEALGLYVCWEEGMLRFFDPLTNSYLRSHQEDARQADEERANRITAEARAQEAAAVRERAEARAREEELRAQEEAAARERAEARAREEEAHAQEESAARERAEARVAELEAELRRLRGA